MGDPYDEWKNQQGASGPAGGTGPMGPVGPEDDVPPNKNSDDKPPTEPTIENEDGGSAKDLSVANLMDAYNSGLIDEDTLKARLGKLGYEAGDVDLLVKLGTGGDNGGGPTVGLSTLFQALESGTLTESQLRQRLGDAGYSSDDVDLLVRTNSVTQAEADRKQAAIDDDPRISEGADWAALDAGAINDSQMIEGLQRRGYSSEEIRRLYAVRDKQKAQQEADSGPSKGGGPPKGLQQPDGSFPGDKPEKKQGKGVRVVDAGSGSSGERPQARAMLADFRSSMTNAIRGATGVSTPAKQWAMDNQDMFLQDYLNTGGKGQAFAIGASQINTLFEGSKGVGRATGSPRDSGTVGTRRL